MIANQCRNQDNNLEMKESCRPLKKLTIKKVDYKLVGSRVVLVCFCCFMNFAPPPSVNPSVAGSQLKKALNSSPEVNSTPVEG